MSGPRFLCAAHDFPVPADNGSSVRVLGVLRLLAECGPVRLVVAPRPSTTPADVEELRARTGVEVVLLDGPVVPPAGGKARLWGQALRRGVPPWFLMWTDARVQAALRQHLGDATHVVLLDDFAAQHVLDLPRRDGVTVVVDKHMVYGSPVATGERRGPKAALAHRLAVANERRVVGLADRVVVTSAEEAARLRALYRRDPDGVVPSAIDPPVWSWSPPRSGPPAALYLGNLVHRPNRQGFVAVLDAMRATGRPFPLLVVGKGADAALRRRAEGLPVTFLGWVPDLAPVLDRVAAAVAPLWAGGGLRLKALELLGAGVPTVATPAALEGVGAADRTHCRVAATPAEVVEATAALLASPRRAAAMGAQGRELVLTTHTWAARGARLRAALGLVAEPAGGRRAR